MKYNKADLIKTFHSKIQYLERQVLDAEQCELTSNMRDEFANNIAVILRTLLCFSSNEKSLCARCGYNDVLLFPFRDPVAAMNLLPQYDLVKMRVGSKDDITQQATFEVDCDIDENAVYYNYLNFRSWMKEIVIDFKTKDCEPISREKIIHIVADRMGAHMDSNIDPYLYKIANDNIMPIGVVVEGKTVEFFCKNLFTETIIAIAKELIISVKQINRFELKQRKRAQHILYMQSYSLGNKYIVCTKAINPYNANNHFECQTYKVDLFTRIIIYGNRKYDINIIDCDAKRVTVN